MPAMIGDFYARGRRGGWLRRNRFNAVALPLSLGFILFRAGVAAGEPVSMRGEIDFTQKTLTVRFVSGSEHTALLKIKPVSETSIQMLAELDDWPTRFFNISTVIEASLDMLPSGKPDGTGLSGQLRSRYTLLNNKPVEDVSARFVLKDQAVSVENVTLGNSMGSGTWELPPPHRFRTMIEFADVPLYDIVSLFMDVPEGAVDGQAAGKIRLSGNAPDVLLQADLLLTNGCIGDLEYRQLRIKGEGFFPKFRITESLVSKADGFTFKVFGMLNLGRLDSFPQQLQNLRRKPVVKSSGAETEWTLKRIETDDKSGTTELKYLYRRKADVNTMSEEDVDLIGVEQKLKF